MKNILIILSLILTLVSCSKKPRKGEAVTRPKEGVAHTKKTMTSNNKKETKKDLAINIKNHTVSLEFLIKSEVANTKFDKIVRLDFRGRGIKDISYLSKFRNLIYLNLSRNEITDISVLSKLPNLEQLYLSSNKIKDISPLKNLKKLEKVNLANNQIEDISPLKDLNSIKKIKLSANKIKDYTPVKNIKEVIK